MPKKKKPNRNAQRRQKPTRGNSSLKDHRQKGRTLTPPMMNIMGDTLRTVAWERDSLPDYLLICHHVRSQTTEAFANLDALINLVDDAAGITYIPDRTATGASDEGAAPTDAPEAAGTKPDEETRKAYTLIGQLTQFEKFTPDERTAALTALEENDAYEALVPEDFAHVLGMYPDAPDPGCWTLGAAGACPWTPNAHKEP